MTWKFHGDSKSDIVLSSNGPEKSNFLFMERFDYFFPLTWKFGLDSKSNIVLYLKSLAGPQKFVIMILCKINFDIQVQPYTKYYSFRIALLSSITIKCIFDFK